ncbi:MAG: hypothetical protein LBK54_06695 [Propionibacteriaceae bacterium]|jgi:MinD-like ATPase involved in chromosome partitioning or flagellar assembly|nr:hypothetical protein [Propionibacteriaceae bacterium]
MTDPTFDLADEGVPLHVLWSVQDDPPETVDPDPAPVDPEPVSTVSEGTGLSDSPSALPDQRAVSASHLGGGDPFGGVRGELRRSRFQEPSSPAWRRVARTVGLPVEAQSRRSRESADERALASRWPTPRTVLVASGGRGGAGKTTVSVLLGAALGNFTGQVPALLDNNPAGDVDLALDQGSDVPTVEDLVAALPELSKDGVATSQTESFLSWQPSGRFVALPARKRAVKVRPDGSVGLAEPTISAAEFGGVWRLVSRSHPLVVVDSGNNIADAPFKAALEVADVLVVPIQWWFEWVDSAVGMLEDLIDAGHGDLARNAIVVGTAKPGGEAPRRQRQAYSRGFADLGLAEPLEIPGDPGLGRETPIHWDTLKPETRAAARHLAARVARGFDRTPRPRV